MNGFELRKWGSDLQIKKLTVIKKKKISSKLKENCVSFHFPHIVIIYEKKCWLVPVCRPHIFNLRTFDLRWSTLNFLQKKTIFKLLDINNRARWQNYNSFLSPLSLSRPAYFKSDVPVMEIKMWRPWQQYISPKCLMSHLYPNGPSTKCSRSVATVTYAYRIVGILRDDKQRRNWSHRKPNCKSFSLGESRLELRTKSPSV